MSETLPNEQAFPIPASHTVQYGSTRTVHGMTKREYFAAMAMQGFSANSVFAEQNFQSITEWSVNLADRLIESLNDKGASKKADDPDKERIIRAYISGLKSDMLNPVSDSLYRHLAEQYYKETYGTT